MAGKNQQPEAGLRRWVPERLDWVPGEPHDKAEITIRDAGRPDTNYLRETLRLTGAEVERALTDVNTTVYLAVRNRWHPVGGVYSTHDKGVNRIVKYAFDRTYPASVRFPVRLLMLPTLEVPESPSTVWVDVDDFELGRLLSSQGWEPLTAKDNRVLWQHAPRLAWGR